MTEETTEISTFVVCGVLFACVANELYSILSLLT